MGTKKVQKLTDKMILTPPFHTYLYIYIVFNTIIQLLIHDTLYIYTPSEITNRDEPKLQR